MLHISEDILPRDCTFYVLVVIAIVIILRIEDHGLEVLVKFQTVSNLKAKKLEIYFSVKNCLLSTQNSFVARISLLSDILFAQKAMQKQFCAKKISL